VGDRPEAWIAFENDGQTPAYDFVISVVVKILPAKLPPGFDFPVEDSFGPDVLAPHAKNFTSKHAKLAVTADDLNQLAWRDSAIYIYGGVTYKDAFESPWHTNFCYNVFYGKFDTAIMSSEGVGIPNNCPTHNDSK
jgi:hypothetical protein